MTRQRFRLPFDELVRRSKELIERKKKPEPFQLKPGKRYFTRDGRFVGECVAVWTRNVGGCQATVLIGEDLETYTLDGHYTINKMEHYLDLVREY